MRFAVSACTLGTKRRSAQKDKEREGIEELGYILASMQIVGATGFLRQKAQTGNADLVLK